MTTPLSAVPPALTAAPSIKGFPDRSSLSLNACNVPPYRKNYMQRKTIFPFKRPAPERSLYQFPLAALSVGDAAFLLSSLIRVSFIAFLIYKNYATTLFSFLQVLISSDSYHSMKNEHAVKEIKISDLFNPSPCNRQKFPAEIHAPQPDKRHASP